MSARDGGVGIALDRDQLIVLMKDKLAATYSAIRADRFGHLCAVMFRAQILGLRGHRFWAGSIGSGFNLLDERPLREQVFQHKIPPWGADELKTW
jgi:hypothetical protein